MQLSSSSVQWGLICGNRVETGVFWQPLATATLKLSRGATFVPDPLRVAFAAPAQKGVEYTAAGTWVLRGRPLGLEPGRGSPRGRRSSLRTTMTS
jgi:hypothetical protein